MNLRNSVRLIGHLGKDPELQQLKSGTHVSRLSLATKDIYTDSKGQRVEDTQWHRLTAWGKTAENMNKFCKKGSEIVVGGRIAYNTYEDKDGVKRKSSEIIVNEFLLLDKKEQEKA